MGVYIYCKTNNLHFRKNAANSTLLRIAVWYVKNLNMAYFKNLLHRTNVKKILHADRTYELFVGWYALNVPYLKGTVRRSIIALNVPYLRGTVRS